MADYFDTAAEKNKAVTSGLLAAIATQGSQAKQAFDAAQAQIATQKQAAVQAALAEATQRGAPTAVTGQVSDTIGQGYDRRSADLGAAQASRASSLGNISAAAGTYMDEANAALPVLRTRQQMAAATNQTALANQIAQLRAQQDAQSQTGQRELTMFEGSLADRKAQRDYEAQQREAARVAQERQDQLQREAAQRDQQRFDAEMQDRDLARQEKAAAAGANPLTEVGGLSGLGALLQGVTNQVGTVNADGTRNDDGGRLLLNSTLSGHQAYDRPLPTTTVVAAKTGLAPALVKGVQLQQQDKAATSVATGARTAATAATSPAAVRKDPNYSQGVQDFLTGVGKIGMVPKDSKGKAIKGAKPVAIGDIVAGLTSHYGPDLVRQIMADYGRAIPGQTAL